MAQGYDTGTGVKLDFGSLTACGRSSRCRELILLSFITKQTHGGGWLGLDRLQAPHRIILLHRVTGLPGVHQQKMAMLQPFIAGWREMECLFASKILFVFYSLVLFSTEGFSCFAAFK